MTKIEFSMNSLRRSVIPSLEKSVDSLNELIKKCSQLYVPSNFKYKSYLSDFISDNVRIKKEVIAVKDWIYKSEKKYSEILEAMSQNSQNLNSIEIGRKYGALK